MRNAYYWLLDELSGDASTRNAPGMSTRSSRSSPSSLGIIEAPLPPRCFLNVSFSKRTNSPAASGA